MVLATSGVRAQISTSRLARRSTTASAVPQAPAPMMLMRCGVISGLDAGADRPRCAGIERPARARREIEAVDIAAPQPLDAGPGDHGRVVAAQPRWRHHQA